MTECPHGEDLALTTREGWPRCALCRARAKKITPPPPPKITPPKFDVQTLLKDD